MAASPNAEEIGDYLVEVDLKKLLGKGTYGQVFLGKHVRTGRKVAAKMLQAEKIYVTEDTDIEARAMMDLPDHENVLKIQDFIKKEVVEHKVYINFWLILEFCPLGNLVDYAAHHSMLLTDKVDLMLQGNHGLLHLHSLKPKAFIHRDLKPSNMLIAGGSDKVVLKLGDFGEVKMIERSHLMSSIRGTKSYWAPEMFSLSESNTKLSYDKSVDIFSKGMSDLALLDCADNQTMTARSENGKELGLYLYQNRNHAVKVDVEKPNDSRDVKQIKKLLGLMIAQNPKERPSIQEVVSAFNYLLNELRTKYQQREPRPALLDKIASDPSDIENRIHSLHVELQRRKLEAERRNEEKKREKEKLKEREAELRKRIEQYTDYIKQITDDLQEAADDLQQATDVLQSDTTPQTSALDMLPNATVADANPTKAAKEKQTQQEDSTSNIETESKFWKLKRSGERVEEEGLAKMLKEMKRKNEQ